VNSNEKQKKAGRLRLTKKLDKLKNVIPIPYDKKRYQQAFDGMVGKDEHLKHSRYSEMQDSR
jgi:hypothetical protein